MVGDHALHDSTTTTTFQAGPLVRLHIPLDHATGGQRKFAFAEYTEAASARYAVTQHGKSAPLAVPELGSCTPSGRAWRFWAARDIQGERPGHWMPSHWLRCSNQLTSKSPTQFTACLAL